MAPKSCVSLVTAHAHARACNRNIHPRAQTRVRSLALAALDSLDTPTTPRSASESHRNIPFRRLSAAPASKQHKKLSISTIAKASSAKKAAPKGKAASGASKPKEQEVPPAVRALLEANPFASVILVEAEAVGDAPLLIITPDFCPKGCGWSALDDGDVELPVAEQAVAKHVASGCKLVAAKDFKGLVAPEEKKAAKGAKGKAAAAAHVHDETCGHAAPAKAVKAVKAVKKNVAKRSSGVKKASGGKAPKAKAAKVAKKVPAKKAARK